MYKPEIFNYFSVRGVLNGLTEKTNQEKPAGIHIKIEEDQLFCYSSINQKITAQLINKYFASFC